MGNLGDTKFKYDTEFVEMSTLKLINLNNVTI